MKPKVSITFPGIRIVTEPLLRQLEQSWIMLWKEREKTATAGRVGSVSRDVRRDAKINIKMKPVLSDKQKDLVTVLLLSATAFALLADTDRKAA